MKLLLTLALFPFSLAAQVVVVPDTGSSYPLPVLPGSIRQIAANITVGGSQCAIGSDNCTVNWTVSATTGGASATFTTPTASNVSSVSAGIPSVQVNIGSTGGTCSISGSIGSYVYASTATVTVQAQSTDDTSKTGTFTFNICQSQSATLANGTSSVVVVPSYKQAFQGQPITLQSFVTGCVDETGTWSITGQPTGGNSTLADTTYRDAKFIAGTVTGRYTVTYTANCNSGTSTAIVYVSPNALPSYAVTPNKTDPSECYPDPALTGADYEIGSGLAYTTISSTPAFSTITSGTIYRLHNTDSTGMSPSTYAEYFQISKNGTPTQPILFCGVPDSLGNLPIMTGANATGQTGINPLYGTVGYGMISLWPASHYGFWQSGSAGPSHISVWNLHITGATPTNTYTQPNGSAECMCTSSGTCGPTTPSNPSLTCPWSVFAAGVQARSGAYLDLSENEIDGIPQGVFTDNNAGSNAWSTYTQAVTANRNYIHGFGYTNSGSHGMYIQSLFALIEGNTIGPPGAGYYTSGDGPSMVKVRGLETIIRYNYFVNNPGANEYSDRILDLVDNQDGPQYQSIDQYLSFPGQTNCNFSFWCLGDTAGAGIIAALDEAFRKDLVYGNVIPWSDGGQIHYGGDHGGADLWNRSGNLYFFDNTVWQGSVLFDDGTAAGDPIYPQNFVLANNIVWPYTGSTVPSFVRYVDEFLSATTNLFETSSISITTPITGGQTGMYSLGWANGGSSPYCGNQTGSTDCTWPLTNPMQTHLPGLGSANYLFTSTQPFTTGTYAVPVGSAAIGAATALTGIPAQNPPRWYYNVSTSSLAARSLSDLTLGAVPYIGTTANSGGSGFNISGGGFH